jgi:CubicO group peptidase (beta-lactamase class C family)
MKKHNKALGLLIGLLIAHSSIAEQSGRPDDLDLANFQFGPHNRWAFSHVREVMPTVNIAHDSRRILRLDRSPDATDDFSVELGGKSLRLNELVRDQYIDGILILKDGKIVVEEYYGHLTADRPHLMMSVTKSVVGLLAGKLAADGVVDLSRSVADYVPDLAKSGWGPDSLRTLLDMRDGADYTEYYEDMNSTVRQQDCAAGWTDADYCPDDGPRGGYEFFPTVGRNEENLGKFVYKSGSTDVIGWVLEEATGEPLAELISKYIWQPMGAEFDAYITVDKSGFVLGDGGMNATLRDLGRFGLLVLADGKSFGEQVVPADFIEDIHSQPGDPEWPYSDEPEDWNSYYRSFWWGQGNANSGIMGLGVHGQLLLVDPEAEVVIALFSSWPRADGDGDTDSWGTLYELGIALVEKFRGGASTRPIQ